MYDGVPTKNVPTSELFLTNITFEGLLLSVSPRMALVKVSSPVSALFHHGVVLTIRCSCRLKLSPQTLHKYGLEASGCGLLAGGSIQ